MGACAMCTYLIDVCPIGTCPRSFNIIHVSQVMEANYLFR